MSSLETLFKGNKIKSLCFSLLLIKLLIIESVAPNKKKRKDHQLICRPIWPIRPVLSSRAEKSTNDVTRTTRRGQPDEVNDLRNFRKIVLLILIQSIMETTVWQYFNVKMETLWKKTLYCHKQSSKSSVTLGAVWRTLTLAGEEQRSWRSVLILHLGPNHLHLSKVWFLNWVFFNLNVGFCCDLEEPYVKTS